MRVTLADVRASRIPEALGVCATDTRVVAWLNEASERLLYEGHWWGTCAKIKICSTNNCITLPPQFATIERVAACGSPIPIHDMWFEFMANGAGVRNEDSCWSECNARGTYPTFKDVRGTNKKLRILCDVADDIGGEVLIKGYDENNNWIRTQQSGIWKDGEIIVLAQSPGTLSTKKFSSITGVQLPSDMSGQSWLYSENVDDSTQIMLGHYQYFETNPSYPRYHVPRLGNCCNSDSDDSCSRVTLIEAICKKAYIPVKSDTDYLVIENIPAMKEMMVAIKKAESTGDDLMAKNIIAAGLASAKHVLDMQLDHQLGSGRKIGIEVVGSSSVGGCPVENFI